MKSLHHSVSAVWRVALCLLLCGVMLCGALSVAAAPTTKGSAQDLGQSGTVQGHLDGLGTANWYKITPNASQYYRFTFYNQSVETRLGVSIADGLLNMFLGKMSIVIYDSYDAILAEGDVKCGYSGSVSLRLEKGQTYYIKLTSTVAGNYRMTTTYFADVGANSWSGAEDMLSNGQMISSIDADGDTDWFKFVADEEQSFYRFALENINGSGNKYFYLYEYVAGAGETPLRDVWNFSVSKGSTVSKDAQLKEGHTYYYRISGSVGGYQLNVGQTLDVAGSEFKTAYAIDTDTKYTTSFDGEGDVDYFKFTTGDQPAYYHFDLDVLYSDNTYLTFYLYDEAGNEAGYHRIHVGDLPYSYNHKLEPSTTYYLRLSKGTATQGNYTVKINTQVDAYPNERENALSVPLDQEFTTSFDGYGDVDFFKFETGDRPAYYHFDMTMLLKDNAYIRYYLYDAAGNEIGYHRVHVGDFPRSVNYKLEPNSTYYFSLDKYTDVIGNYTIKVNTQVDAYPNERENAVTVPLDQEFTTSFDGYGDVDFFKFETGDRPAYYHFDMTMLLKDNAYIRYYLYDAAGNEIGYHRVHVGDFPRSVNYKLEPNSTYYFMLDKYTDVVGNYTIKINTQVDGHANEQDGATVFQRDEEYTASFDGYGDVDCFKFTAGSQNAYYYINWKVLFSDNTYLHCYIHDEAGNEVGHHRIHCGDLPMNPAYKLNPNSTYYLRFEKYTDVVGNYTFSVETVADPEGNSMGEALAVQLNKPATYRLAISGDVDWFTFTVDYDNDYRIRLVNETGGSFKAWLYNEYEREIKSLYFSSGRDEVISLTAGRYYIKVQREYGDPKYYTLAVADCGGGHNEKTTYPTPATTDREGVKRTVCSYCGTVIKTEKVARLATVKLTKTTWECTGKALTPKLKVVDADGNTVSSSYYTLKTSADGKTPGKYTVTVTFKGKYSGTKKLSYTVVLATPKVTAKGNGSTIKVTWNKVPAATTYVVYRRQYVGGKWSSWTKITTTKSTAYTHSSPTAGRQYRYAVKAYRGSAVSELGSSVSAVKLAKPTAVKAKGKTAGTTISWKKVTGAKGYCVYARKYSGGKWGSWSKIKVTTSTSYTHKSATYGANYQYRIRAYYEDSVSADSAIVSATRLKAPTGVKSKKSGAAIKTSWNKVTGASTYVVYRRTYNTKTRKYGAWIKVKTTSSTSYTDKGAKKGTTYQYSVVACKGSHASDRKSGSKVKR